MLLLFKGFFGAGNSRLSLDSIMNTNDIDGLSSGHSCTHKRPTCMHLNNSVLKTELSTAS
jgi:hypothetical protein